jgi:hypothetical protein
MRGRQFFNFPAFDAARDALTAMGHTVVSPADIDRANGFDGMALDPSDPCDRIPEGFDLDGCILGDIAEVLKADGICFIDLEWFKSKGARAECATAIWRGKRLFEFWLDRDMLVEITVPEAERLMMSGPARTEEKTHTHWNDPNTIITFETGNEVSITRKET